MKTVNNSLARISTLINNAEKFDAASLALAMKESDQRAVKAQLERNVALVDSMKAQLRTRVDALRDIRKKEKEAMALVEKFDNALANFIKSGDLEEYNRVTGAFLR